MSWIALDESFFTHRKTRKLKRRLHTNVEKLAGHMARLWQWGLKNSGRDGVLHNCEPEDIAEPAHWPERGAQEFVEALLEAGFLDKEGDEYCFHNWAEHTQPYYDGQESAAENASKSGTYGNHKRWHLNKGVYSEDCKHCVEERDPQRRAANPQLPLGPTLVPDIGANRGDIASESLPTHSTSPTDRSTRSTQRANARDLLRFKLQLLPGELETLKREFPSVDVDRRFSEWVDWVLEEEKGRSPRRGNRAAFKGFLKADNGLKVAGGGR